MWEVDRGEASSADKEDQVEEQDEGRDGSEEAGGVRREIKLNSSSRSSSSATCFNESRFQSTGLKIECHSLQTRAALAKVVRSR